MIQKNKYVNLETLITRLLKNIAKKEGRETMVRSIDLVNEIKATIKPRRNAAILFETMIKKSEVL